MSIEAELAERPAAAPQGDPVTSGSAIHYHNKRRLVSTPSSVMVSSSRWLNDPVIRDWISTEALRRNGDDYPLLYGLPGFVDAFDRVEDADYTDKLIKEERRKNKKLDKWFDERHFSTYTVADLLAYPENSVGRLLGDYMKRHDLAPELDPRRMADPDLRPVTDIQYFHARMGQNHDFLHLLGEVGFTVTAEYFPTGFLTGNAFANFSPDLAGAFMQMNTLIMFPWLFRCMLHYPAAFPTLWRNISHGYEAGSKSAEIFTARYETVLEMTIPEARKALGWWDGYVRPEDSAAASAIYGEGREIID